jgi:hypothetical protein
MLYIPSIFFTYQHRLFFSRNLTNAHILCGDVHVDLFIKNIRHFKIFFLGRGSVCTLEPNGPLFALSPPKTANRGGAKYGHLFLKIRYHNFKFKKV